MQIAAEVSAPYVYFDHEQVAGDTRFKNDLPLGCSVNKKLLFSVTMNSTHAVDLISSYNFAVPNAYKPTDDQ